MSDQQHSVSVEEVTASLQRQHGLGDRPPTLAVLPGLLRNESEQLGLGRSRRSMGPSIVNINLATSHEILRRLGDGCCVKMDRDYGTIVHPPTADPLVSDLDQVQQINIHILAANRFTDDAATLQKLAKRLEAKVDARESASEPSGGSADLTRPHRKHKADAGNRLKRDAKRELVLQYLNECGGWEGMLAELRAALKGKKGLGVSEPTLCRYLKGTKYQAKGSPARVACVPGKPTGEREAVTAESGPANMATEDNWTMPDDPDA